tara:strand:- start:7835 stop:8176 length:342 start_codon:yes stop_codon:yes gene_type:complete
MEYEQKEGSGALWSQPSAEVLGKGEVLLDGKKVWVYVLQEFDREGKPRFSILSEAGRIFFNPQEEKRNPKGPDFGGSIKAEGIEYQMAMWQKTASNGNSFLSVNAERKEGFKR